MNKKASERRKHKRLLFTIEDGIIGIFSPPGSDKNKITASVMNISEGGIQLTFKSILSNIIKEGDRLLLTEIRGSKSSQVIVKTVQYPSYEGLNFFEERNNVYKAYYTPEVSGFETLLAQTVSVNYQSEFENIGLNPDLEKIVQITGGKILPKDASVIAETIKASRQVQSTNVVDMSWYFVVGAIVLYLIEITLRKIYEMKTARKY